MNYFLFSSHNSAHIEIIADLVAIIRIPLTELQDHFEKLRAHFVVDVHVSCHFRNTREVVRQGDH